jgi:long-chain acyl-CoA synthetase
MPNVKDVTVSAMPNPITGQVVMARFNLFEPEDLPVFRRRMREFCASRLAAFKVPARIEIVSNAQYGERFKKMRRGNQPAAMQTPAGAKNNE